MKLVSPDDPILTDIAVPVDFPNKEIGKIAALLMRAMMTNGGCGIAAPQLGIPLRILAYHHDGKMGTIVNPTITYKSPDIVEYTEGCLTFPGKMWRTKRSKDIRISFYNLEATEIHMNIDGFLAIILQHECDHLNGILISQHGIRVDDKR